jgi:putative endonuclease
MNRETIAVYIVASFKGVLYTGFTTDLPTRIEQHQSGAGGQFSSKYKTSKLVWCELTDSIEVGREREAQIKRWRRSKKVWLIERENPYWEDISEQIG